MNDKLMLEKEKKLVAEIKVLFEEFGRVNGVVPIINMRHNAEVIDMDHNLISVFSIQIEHYEMYYGRGFSE